jgi:hypothetical protein
MAAGSRVGGDGGNVDGGELAGGCRAEEAVAGYRMALQALRELVVYPSLYAREAQRIAVLRPPWHRKGNALPPPVPTS